MLKLKKNMAAMLVAVAMVMCFVLCGYGTDDGTQYHTQSAGSDSVVSIRDESVPTSGPGNDSDGSGGTTHTSTVRERFRALKGEDSRTGSGNKSTKPKTGSTAGSGAYDAAAIAAIADMKSSVEGITNQNYCVVSIEDEHNPYDVVWDYGNKYDAFVEAVDKAGMWDILFDIDFYTKHYPMLALQYHDDEDLLLEHFQTVGIHEGRQGSDGQYQASLVRLHQHLLGTE